MQAEVYTLVLNARPTGRLWNETVGVWCETNYRDISTSSRIKWYWASRAPSFHQKLHAITESWRLRRLDTCTHMDQQFNNSAMESFLDKAHAQRELRCLTISCRLLNDWWVETSHLPVNFLHDSVFVRFWRKGEMDIWQKSRQYVLWESKLVVMNNDPVKRLTYLHFGEFETSEVGI